MVLAALSVQMIIVVVLVVAAGALTIVAMRQRRAASGASGGVPKGGGVSSTPASSPTSGFSFRRPDRDGPGGGSAQGIPPPAGLPAAAGYGPGPVAAQQQGMPGGVAAQQQGMPGGVAAPPASVPVPPPASVAPPATPAGWFADPSARFQMRYWDGTGWSGHVTNPDGSQAFDPPPQG